MPISMHKKARYVTQSSAYDLLLVGRVLTDRIIRNRQKQGYFGGLSPEQPKKENKHKATLKSLLKFYA